MQWSQHPVSAYSLNGRKATNFSLLEDFRKSTGKHNGWATRQRTSFGSTEGAQERLYIKLRGGHEWVRIYPLIKDKKSKWWAQGVDKPKQELTEGGGVINVAVYLRYKR